eukprot:CAMPEP_0184865976 /NCGR_PEP_ID=MMETSP0580-20130426/20087_1 /TAXON_ID=1118495 /ORGANISM="Dactyliosolen fragilissimus" /LENGTH=331 /DNA_ID=CAMNT_0027365397 /DNA_START=11 /DNA_END=1006 /DNA_ORIENTATION=+
MGKTKAMFLLQITACLALDCTAFTTNFVKFSKKMFASPEKRMQSSLRMALTPVGPFCPFRSSASNEMNPKMEYLNDATPNFAIEMARLQLDMQTGQKPDPDRLKKVAAGINSAVDDWEDLLARLRLSNDFQTREYAKLTQAHLGRHGQTSEEISVMMRWQSKCMVAMAENQMPPPPPAGMDIMKMMEEAKSAQEGKASSPPSINAMAAANKITSTPFTGDESAFKSDTVKDEYKKLCLDHASLIDMGASYASFDGIGKLAFLDEIEKIEERWDIFYARFSLLGQLNRKFVNQCEEFLKSMSLSESEFRELLKEAHNIMREDAERERNLLPQ